MSGLHQASNICLLLEKPYSMKVGALKLHKTLNLLGVCYISKANYNWKLLKQKSNLTFLNSAIIPSLKNHSQTTKN